MLGSSMLRHNPEPNLQKISEESWLWSLIFWWGRGGDANKKVSRSLISRGLRHPFGLRVLKTKLTFSLKFIFFLELGWQHLAFPIILVSFYTISALNMTMSLLHKGYVASNYLTSHVIIISQPYCISTKDKRLREHWLR